MRRLSLLLCALLLALGVATPVHAQGQGLPDVAPDIIAVAPGFLVVYENIHASVGSGEVFYSTAFDGSWHPWQAINSDFPTPSPAQGGLAAMAPFGGAYFTQTLDNKMWCGNPGKPWQQTAQAAGGWANFRQASQPSVLNYGNNTARILGVSANGVVTSFLWNITFSNGCVPNVTDPASTGANSVWSPAIAGTNDNTDVLMTAFGTDGHTYFSYNHGVWQQTTPGGNGSGAMGLTTWGGGRYDLFVRGTDGSMYHNWNNQAWENLSAPLGDGQLASGPRCASWGPNRIDCVVIGTDGNVWIRSWTGAQWANWANLGSA